MNAVLLRACEMAYRKHCMNDPSIGWKELEDILFDALVGAMGSGGYLAWKESLDSSDE